MSEQIESVNKRGRQKGEIKAKGYIHITDDLRLRVEEDCIIWEELTSKINNTWGNYKYFTSWGAVIERVIRRFSTERISKKETLTFKEAKKEILFAIGDVKRTLIGDIEKEMKNCSDEVLNRIKGFSK